MNKLGIPSVLHERVTLEVGDSAGGIVVSVVGDIDMEDPSVLLDPFFLELHEKAVRQGVRVVDVDFRKLRFLNSSGIKTLAKWAMMLAGTQEAKRYAIRMIHDKAVAWQATSLPTLSFLVPGAIVLE